ncbi:response regulator transcription factor [Clostridium sediminicola]|uniref:response regulator n=1 Tax=Clostridium sediminicola TaxID=3114879 RepID=UPI0031F24144
MIKCIIAEDFETLNNIYYNLINYEKDLEVIGRAYNGSEVVKLAQKHEADIILMDIEMDSKDTGIKATKEILNMNPNIKIIMLTCHEDEEAIIEAYEAGAVDYVLKTASSSEILEAIRQAYNDSSPIRSYAATTIRKKLVEFENLRNNLLNVVNMISSLTNTEIGIMNLLMDGKKQKEIAAIRGVELVTIKYHVGNIIHKFGCKKTSEVKKLMIETGAYKFLKSR